jgi:hypothetical protein
VYGGGGGSAHDNLTSSGGPGANGAIYIVWPGTRGFPSNL